MNQVEPIRNKEDIKRMYQVLSMKSKRDYLFFKLAIHTGIRLTDLLKIEVKDIKNPQRGNIKTAWIENTVPSIKIKLPETLRQELTDYIDDYQLANQQLLFQSIRTHQALSRQQAYRIIHQAAEELGILHIGLTTLRKTFAYHAYESGISISIIQKYLGHQTTQETMKFIGIKKIEKNQTVIALNL